MTIRHAAAQEYQRRYDAFGQQRAQNGWSIEPLTDSTWLVVLNGQLQVGNLVYSSVVGGLILNADGVALDTTVVFREGYATYPGWANAAAARQAGGVLVGGSNKDSLNTDRPVLYLFGPTGQVDTLYSYGITGEDWIGRCGKQTPDGGYVITGETNTGGISVDGFLLKVDSLGNQEWVQTYGQANRSEVLTTVDLAPGSGYYLGGQASMGSGNYDQWLLQVDGSGDVIWEEEYPTPYHDPSTHVTTMADGTAVFATAWSVNADDDQVLALVKVAPNGSTAWSKTYDGAAYNTTLFAVKEVSPGGDLIAVGQSSFPSLFNGVLLRTTAQGDSLWLRYYQYADSVWTQGHGTLRDVVPTADGGFIAVGRAMASSNNPNDPPIYGQDTWVVKVDSMGCLEPGCHVVTGVETQITNLRSVLRVWPNPIQGQAQAQGQAQGQVQVAIELPERFVTRGPLRLTLTDAQGRLVQEESVPEGISPFSFQLSALAPGLYHLHLSDASRWISGAKVVVE